MKTSTQTILFLLMLAHGLAGFGQTDTLNSGLMYEKVISLRSELVNKLKENDLQEAKKITNILISSQSTSGEYLADAEYFMALFLMGEFDKILALNDSTYNFALKTNYPDISAELRDETRVQMPAYFNAIETRYGLNEKLVLNSLLMVLLNSKEGHPPKKLTINDLSNYKLNKYDWEYQVDFGFGTTKSYKNIRSSYLPSWYALGEYDEKAEKYDDEFIYLFNDSMIDCSSVKYNRRFREDNTISCDSITVNANQVKFYSDGKYYFANIGREGRKPTFIKRYKSGKINYFKIDYRYTQPAYTIISTTVPQAHNFYTSNRPDFNHPEFDPFTKKWKTRYVPAHEVRVLDMYYNFGFDDVKKATYKNLMQDISHNPNSKYFLDKYKKKSRTESTLAIIGSSLIVGGLAVLGVSPGVTVISSGSGLIILAISVAKIINSDKEFELDRAIKAYYRCALLQID